MLWEMVQVSVVCYSESFYFRNGVRGLEFSFSHEMDERRSL